MFRSLVIFSFLLCGLSAAQEQVRPLSGVAVKPESSPQAQKTTTALPGDHLVKNTRIPVQLTGISKDMLASIDEVVALQLELSSDTEASPALADDLAFFVRRSYLEQGWLSCDVDWSLNSGTIVLAVKEGVQLQVGTTVFPGNPDLSEEDLRRYLIRPTRERVGSFLKSTPYVEDEIAKGRDLVLRYVLSQGYADATVDDPVATIHQETGATDLSVTIHPGVQWQVGTITVVDAPRLLEETVESLQKTLPDQPMNDARIETARRRLEGEVQSAGYFSAKVASTTVRAAAQKMDVTFTVTTGALYRVDRIQLEPGFSKGASRLLRSAFKPAVGKVYDSKRMDLAYGRILDTGLFEHLEMDPEPVTDASLALLFHGTEAKRQRVSLTGGYDTFQGGIVGVEYTNVNFMNTGGMLRLKALMTSLGYQAGAQWKDPALFNSAYALAVDFLPETFTFEGYTRNTAALRVGISRDLTRRLTLETHVGGSTNKVESDTLTDLELGPKDYTLETAGLTLKYEGRDNPVTPTKGWYLSATVEGGRIDGGMENVQYTQTDFAASYYHPLSEKWRVAVGAHFGSLITDKDVTQIPIELRLYNGGAKGVRSFAERELGPIAKDGTPLGGTQTQTVSGELSYEIVKNLEIAGFVDAGSLSGGKGGILPEFDDMRYAAGLGLRYRLPFGPLRVDYGVNLNRRTGEAMGALHIGFGFAF